MAKYLVGVEISTYVEIEVDADDEQEAREIARLEAADPSTCDDWSYSVDYVECIDDEG
jgi:hypothetical protein